MWNIINLFYLSTFFSLVNVPRETLGNNSKLNKKRLEKQQIGLSKTPFCLKKNKGYSIFTLVQHLWLNQVRIGR